MGFDRFDILVGMRVLVIEDYSPLRHALVRGLREAGYAVDAVGDGAQGLEFAEAEAHDLVILDIMLPQVDGFSLLQDLRAQQITTPVLVLRPRIRWTIG